jgi:hypothetical protein
MMWITFPGHGIPPLAKRGREFRASTPMLIGYIPISVTDGRKKHRKSGKRDNVGIMRYVTYETSGTR